MSSYVAFMSPDTFAVTPQGELQHNSTCSKSNGPGGNFTGGQLIENIRQRLMIYTSHQSIGTCCLSRTDLRSRWHKDQE